MLRTRTTHLRRQQILPAGSGLLLLLRPAGDAGDEVLRSGGEEADSQEGGDEGTIHGAISTGARTTGSRPGILNYSGLRRRSHEKGRKRIETYYRMETSSSYSQGGEVFGGLRFIAGEE